MRNIDNDNEFLWNRNKFLNRKYLMQEMYQNFVDGDKDWDREKVSIHLQVLIWKIKFHGFTLLPRQSELV